MFDAEHLESRAAEIMSNPETAASYSQKVEELLTGNMLPEDYREALQIFSLGSSQILQAFDDVRQQRRFELVKAIAVGMYSFYGTETPVNTLIVERADALLKKLEEKPL